MTIFKPRHLTIAALLLSAAPALAQGNQEGLVNVDVEGNTVQVPVSVAANVCGVDVNVIAQDFAGTDETACSIDQETAAENDMPGYGDGANGGGNQNGLVNLDVSGNTVQVPVGVAANVCGVDANVLATEIVGTDEAACTIDQETAAANDIALPEEAGTGGEATEDAAETAEDAAETAEDVAEEATEEATESGN